MKKIAILYHYDCPDGFGAAWAAWKKFGKKADYFAVKHQVPPPPGLKNKDIYMLDFTYFGGDLKKLIRENTVTTIDHHIGAKKEILSAPRHVFTLNHSGAVLASRFFHPKKPVPWLLRFIEDRDLWRFKLPGTRAVLTVVDLSEFNFLKWNKIAADLEKPALRKKYAREGQAMLKFEDYVLSKIVQKSDWAEFLGRRALVINSSSVLKSEVGNALLKRGAKLAIVWRREAKKIYVSLRSTTIDVSKLAKHYGGGGHKAAAGFTYDARLKLPWKYL